MDKLIVPALLTVLLLLGGCGGEGEADKKSSDRQVSDQELARAGAANKSRDSRRGYVSTSPPASDREVDEREAGERDMGGRDHERAGDRERERGRDRGRDTRPPASDDETGGAPTRKMSEEEEYRSEHDRDIKSRRGQPPERAADRGDRRDSRGDRGGRPGADARGRGAPPLVPAFPEAPGTVGLSEGDIIPEIEGEDTEGVSFKLSDYEGKVIMLDFWGDW